MKVARFREAISVDANDFTDAEAVARLLIVQPDLEQAPVHEAIENDAHGSTARRLRQRSRRHARWTQEQTALCNELHAVLRLAWLADYQAFFSRIDGAAALAFWQTYPTPAHAAAAEPAALAAMLRQVSRGRLNDTRALENTRHIHAVATRMVAAFGEKSVERGSIWAEDIRELAESLAYMTAKLARLVKRMAAELEAITTPLTSFKGIGPITAATIHGEILTVDRFATPTALRGSTEPPRVKAAAVGPVATSKTTAATSDSNGSCCRSP